MHVTLYAILISPRDNVYIYAIQKIITRRVIRMKTMSKKMITIVCLTSALLMMLGSVCFASRVNVGAFQHSLAQIETDSVTCDEYNPPIYQLSADWYWSDSANASHVTYRYNYDLGTMYMYTASGEWHQIDNNDSSHRAEFNRKRDCQVKCVN